MILLLLVVFVSYIYYMAHFGLYLRYDKYNDHILKNLKVGKGIYCIIAYIPFL